ncbi:hypothetical protein [Frederiksenia canicola]|uniref:Uncharacterized protein n=1 Tax=Frederiksenia canicola TaxID=123824 RepID=A0AAE7C2P3_9PAST|nr:hypothetical protein [Frederiksenia canicola]QIM65357.1 hypothetical protein A4G17_07820 [Frederiksenia canicola]RPE96207.1 hypothetical protein EDC49_0595 [Frederiksenia canicola]
MPKTNISELDRLKSRRRNRELMDTIYSNKSNNYVVHYSCESFYDEEYNTFKSGRITSIGLRNLEDAQTHYWSIWLSAEVKNKEDQIDEYLDELEKDVLDSYFNFIRINSRAHYIHWNMRDINYGFQALEHRYKVLGGEPVIITDDRKFDLARVLVSLYGRNYASHEYTKNGKEYKGRMMVLAAMNNVAVKDAMEGRDEANAFKEKNYKALHMSTLRKLDMLANFFDRAHANKLKNNGTFREKYGFHWIVIFELIKAHPAYTALIVLAAISSAIYKFTDIFSNLITQAR